MAIEIREEPIASLSRHAAIPIVFTVRSRMHVGDERLVEVPVECPFVKDYDAAGGGGPATWAARFDVSRWGLLVARWDGRRVAGAVVAWRTRGLSMLEGRDDVAVLWDLRVAPAHRRAGVGAALFDRAAAWACARGCVRLDVETQDLNVAACRLYASRGCVLRRVDPHAYPTLPAETMLLWSLALDERGPPGTRMVAPPDGPWGGTRP